MNPSHRGKPINDVIIFFTCEERSDRAVLPTSTNPNYFSLPLMIVDNVMQVHRDLDILIAIRLSYDDLTG